VLEYSLDRPGLKAVIFDVDGTLYRQAPLRRAMARRLLRAHLFHPGRGMQTIRALAAYRRAQEELRTEPGRDDLAEAQLCYAARSTGLARDTVAQHVAQWMETAPLELLPRFVQPGLEDLLHALRSWDLRLGVLSDYRAELKLEALGVAGLFDVVVCAQQPEIGVFKPHPRGLQVALERLGISACEALYIGDRADLDAVAAAAAEIPCAILAEPRRARRTVGKSFLHISSFHDMRARLEPT
jgi:FMN phosphatase YigB (HAD superfamily)